MSAFAKAPRLPRDPARQDDYIARAVHAFDAAAARRAENPVFREPEHVDPSSLGAAVATVLSAVLAVVVVYVAWCGMYALLGGAR